MLADVAGAAPGVFAVLFVEPLVAETAALGLLLLLLFLGHFLGLLVLLAELLLLLLELLERPLLRLFLLESQLFLFIVLARQLQFFSCLNVGELTLHFEKSQ